jgi:hypothetical protein
MQNGRKGDEMTDIKQPEALRLADELESFCVDAPVFQAADELRRLHEVNAELLEALKALIDMDVAYQRGEKVVQAVEAAKAAIAKAEVTK